MVFERVIRDLLLILVFPGVDALRAEQEPESGALAGLALQCDRAAHRLGQLAGNAEPEARATKAP